MLLNIILFIGMYPIVFILYFVLKWSSTNRSGTVFGLCVPKDKALAEEFYKQVDEKELWYRRRMRNIFIILLIIPLPTFAIPYVSIQFTIWMFWLLGGMVLLELPCMKVHQELKVWKKNAQAGMLLEGQFSEEKEGMEIEPSEEDKKIQSAKIEMQKSDRVRLIELSEAGQVRKTKLLPFLVPTLVSAAIVLAYALFRVDSRAQRMIWVVILFALCTPMFYVAAGWLDRQRTAVVSYNSEININFARAKKQIWNRFWLFCAWVNTAFTAFAAFALRNDEISVIWLLWGTIFYMAITMLLLLFTVRQLNRIERHYKKKIDPMLNEEDDDCWIFGMFYYNKADKRTFTETRIGYGATTNMATPLGKGLLIFSGIAILSVLVLCIWMIMEEFTPIKLNIQGNYLIAEQLKTDYRIEVGEIEELELVDELPELSKNRGTGMDNLYKGNWHIIYAGDCEVFLNPQNEVFLKFTVDGELYYMSAADDYGTQEIYAKLNAKREKSD